MLSPSNKNNFKSLGKQSGFTLVELIIVIAIIGLMTTSIRYMNFNEINNKKRVEVFTNTVSRTFEATRNSALFGRSFLSQNPDAWRVSIDLTNSGTILTEYLSGVTWNTYNDQDFSYVVEFPGFINSLNCDTSGDISTGTGIVEFHGRELSFSGACDINDKYMTIGTNYASFTGAIRINSISGVIETIE